MSWYSKKGRGPENNQKENTGKIWNEYYIILYLYIYIYIYIYI